MANEKEITQAQAVQTADDDTMELALSSDRFAALDIASDLTTFPATKTYNDSIILTSGEITDRRHIYGLGARGSGIETVWRLYRANRFYYATNADGALVRAYIKAVKDRERQRLM